MEDKNANIQKVKENAIPPNSLTEKWHFTACSKMCLE